MLSARGGIKADVLIWFLQPDPSEMVCGREGVCSIVDELVTDFDEAVQRLGLLSVIASGVFDAKPELQHVREPKLLVVSPMGEVRMEDPLSVVFQTIRGRGKVGVCQRDPPLACHDGCKGIALGRCSF